jgi:hypothetical protein
MSETTMLGAKMMCLSTPSKICASHLSLVWSRIVKSIDSEKLLLAVNESKIGIFVFVFQHGFTNTISALICGQIVFCLFTVSRNHRLFERKSWQRSWVSERSILAETSYVCGCRFLPKQSEDFENGKKFWCFMEETFSCFIAETSPRKKTEGV